MTDFRYDIPESFTVETHLLERMRFSVQRMIDEAVIYQGIDFDWIADREAHALVYTLRAGVLGQNLEPIVIEHPADWWQALKERWLPGWGLRRWPVRYKRIKIEAQVLYPRIERIIPDQQSTLLYSVASTKVIARPYND